MKSTLGVAVLMLALSLANSVNDVAFSAGLSQTKSFSTGQTVVYDWVFVNEGNGYNPQNGIFTCPKAGLYVFHFHGLSPLGAFLDVQLVQNDRSRVSAFAESKTTYDSGGNTVIVNLAVGDKVKTVTNQPSSLYGYSKFFTPYTTFSGYRITSAA